MCNSLGGTYAPSRGCRAAPGRAHRAHGRRNPRNGLEQLTLRGLARRGLDDGVVNHYFVDKRDLLVATFRSRTDVAWRRAESEMASGASPLEAIVEGALPVDEERLANWKVWMAFWGAAIGDDDLTAVQLERYRSFLAAVERALEIERKQGRIRDDVDIATKRAASSRCSMV